MEWSQILCNLVGFTETNTELFLLRHIPFKRGLSFLHIFLVKNTIHKNIKSRNRLICKCK